MHNFTNILHITGFSLTPALQTAAQEYLHLRGYELNWKKKKNHSFGDIFDTKQTTSPNGKTEDVPMKTILDPGIFTNVWSPQDKKIQTADTPVKSSPHSKPLKNTLCE